MTTVALVDNRPSDTAAVATILVLAPLVVVAVVLYLVFILARALWRRYRAAVAAREQRRADLLARADQQHAWVLAGDRRGTYGC